MSLFCCCSFSPKPKKRGGRNPLQPTSPPSIPYSILEPRFSEIPNPTKLPNDQRRPSIAGDAYAVELDQLVVDDSESEKTLPQPNKKPSGPLNAVRIKITQRISHEANAKRHTQTSVGNSPGEVARRAELKRLMHKRIQDELQGQFQDEKPKEKSETKDKDQKSDSGSSLRSIKSNRYLSSLIELASPGTGPRDNIEFAVNHIAIPERSTGTKDASYERPCNDENRPDCATQCPHPPPNTKDGLENTIPGLGELTDHDCSLVLAGASPSIPQNSFQLSNSATRLDRVLGPDSGFASRRGSSTWDGQSALRVWLIAQGLRSRDGSIVQPDDSDRDESVTHHTSSEYHGEVETVSDVPLSNAQSQTTTIGPSITRSTDKFDPNGIRKQLEDLEIRGKGSGTENLQTVSPSIETLRGNLTSISCQPLVDNTSSSYPSVLPSFQPSPVRSRPNLHCLNVENFQSFQLSPFDRYGSISITPDLGNSEDQGSYRTAFENLPASSDVSGDVQGYRHPTQIAFDTASMSQSETVSFLQREAELRTIEKRFGDVLARKKPSSRLTSRFREEFEHPVLEQASRSSLISKIQLTMPRRFRPGSKGQDFRENTRLSSETPETPITAAKDQNKQEGSGSKRAANLNMRSHMRRLSFEDYPRPERAESATDLWQRAIRLEAESRRGSSHRLSASLSEHKKASSTSQSLNLGIVSWKGDVAKNSSLHSDPLGWDKSKQSPQSNEALNRHHDSHTKWLIQRWVSQMLPESSQGSAYVEGLGQPHSTKKIIKPPQSWAKFPSHTRDDRTKSATAKDNIRPKDFAIKEISPDGQVLWTTDRRPDEPRMHVPISRSLSMKVGKAVKEKFAKFMQLHKGDSREEKGRSAKGCQNSIQPRGQLEYPELEILPTESGYHELRALGQQIDTMRGGMCRIDSREALTPHRSVKSLGSRISTLIHEVVESPHDCERAYIKKTETLITPRSRFSLSDGPSYGKAASEVPSPKGEQELLRGSRSEMNILSYQPRPTPFRQLQDDFRRELESILQRENNSLAAADTAER